MLVVLLIVSLTAGIVVPRMTTMGASFDFALKREAFEQTMRDPEFLADVAELKLDLSPVTGPQIQSLVSEIVSTPSSIASRLKDIIGTSD